MTGAPPSARRRTMKDPPMKFAVDRLIFGPDDVDLARSPLADHFASETYVLGAFNPGMTRLPNGNLLMMVRVRSEEHTSELQSLMRISYAVFCLKKKKMNDQHITMHCTLTSNRRTSTRTRPHTSTRYY